MANWTPEGFIGQLFKTIGKHMPPPAGAKSPALWAPERGSPICSRRKLRPSTPRRAISCSAIGRPSTGWRCSRLLRPVLKTFAALQPASQAALESDLKALMDQFNRSGDGSVVIPSEYLEIVITRR